MFKSSRGLAQINFIDFICEVISRQFLIIGNGSTPVSAILPANTEILLSTNGFKDSKTESTCFIVMTAVTFTLTPNLHNSFIAGAVGIPFVFVLAP